MALENIIDSEMKKYVITSAQANAGLNHSFYDSLQQYCDHNDAELLVLPLPGKNITETDMHPALYDANLVFTEQRLSKHVKVENMPVRPQQILPLTGVARYAQSDVTTIIGSPKQQMKVVPNSNKKLPKVMMSSGAITKPNYNLDTRIGKIAKEDHVYGAVVAEIGDRGLFHYRQLAANQNGKFYDLGVMYDGKNEPTEVRPEALVLGDWHTGDTSPKVKKATTRLIDELDPKRVIIHDLYNGHSINHHEEGNIVTQVKSYETNHLSLEKELNLVTKELQYFISTTSDDTEIVVVKSNHDEWLMRYVQEGRFLKEPHNAKVGADLLSAAFNGENLLQYAVSQRMDIPNRVKFLERDDDYKVRGWQLGSHGDLGANGGRGSIRSKEFAHGKSITGHSHTPEILRDTYVVGTSTRLDLDYVKGLSSWMNTHALLYPNGKAQMVNITEGKYQ